MKDELISLANKVVSEAIKYGFEEAAAKVSVLKETMVKIANSEPSVIQDWDNTFITLYMSRDKKIVVSSIHSIKPESISQVISKVAKGVENIKPSILYAPLPEPQRVTSLSGTVDKKILEAMDEPSNIAETIIEVAHRERIDSIAGMFSLRYSEKALVTSKGAELYEEASMIETYIRAFAGDGSGQWALGSRTLDLRSIEDMARIASKYAVESKNSVEIEPGEYDIILSPMVAGNLLNYVARMSSAYYILMGVSIFMKNRPGDIVASSKLTIIDAPRDKSLPGSTAFDDEGLETYNKPIIEKGVLRNILHNTKTASKMGAKSTANAGWIAPSPWALKVESGDYTLDEMIGEVKNGLLVTNNWYTRLQNYIEGVFSTITRDALFLIKDGEIVKPVKKLRIADTFPKFLHNIYALTKESYPIKWWEVETATQLPYILVRNVKTSKHTV